ncbi:MAG: outer membrane protein transport protein [Flavipsychrobacter sp.]|nr:outer membrane protein transport protein [Flavipsychrobacter sp.]
MKKYLLALMGLVPAITAGAGGFQLNLQGIRQLAMGGTGTALTWNSDIIFYNPAGMADLNVWEASVSALAIMPGVQYVKDNYSIHAQQQVFTPFNVYVGGPIRKTKNKVAAGIGIYTPFGSGLKWDDNWQGRYVTQEIGLQTIFVQPTLSYKFSERFSVGAGYVIGYGNVRLRKAIPIQDANGQDGSARLQGEAWGNGFNAGIHYKLTKKIQLGLAYRHGVNMRADFGTARFQVASSLADSFPATKFRTRLRLPGVASFGVGYRPVQKLTLQADVNYVMWSSYDSLKFDFVQNTQQLQDISSPRMYQNRFTYRFGLNYAFSPKLAVMLGAAWDESPVQDGFVTPDLPDADRMIGTGGLAWRPVNKLTLTLAVEYVTTQPRKGDYSHEHFSGTYQTKAITPGIGIAYDF